MKIEEMADVFLNSANFAPHAFLTLAPPSGYALNLKVLIKVSKVSWRSQLSYEILRSSFERKFDKTNFISPKKLLPGHSGLRGSKEPENPDLNYWQLTVWIVHWLLDTKVKVICSRVQLTPSFCVWLSYYSLFHLWQILLGLTLIHFNSAENLICQSSAHPYALYLFFK